MGCALVILYEAFSAKPTRAKNVWSKEEKGGGKEGEEDGSRRDKSRISLKLKNEPIKIRSTVNSFGAVCETC